MCLGGSDLDVSGTAVLFAARAIPGPRNSSGSLYCMLESQEEGCRPVLKPRGASVAGEYQRSPAVRAGGVQRTPVTCIPSAFSQMRLVGVAQGCLFGCCAALIAGGEEMGREPCSAAKNYPRPFGQWCFGPWVVEYVVSPFFTGLCFSSHSSWPAGKCSTDMLPTRCLVSIFQCSAALAARGSASASRLSLKVAGSLTSIPQASYAGLSNH